MMQPAPKLFPAQQALIDQGFLESDANWLLCTPTGSGKTYMGQWAMERAWAKGQSAAYVAPLRAIVEEKRELWSRTYPNLEIGTFTGASAKSATPELKHQLLLFTPEKLGAYLNSWKQHLVWLSRLGVLVIDEIHLLGDASRGASLECLIRRIERINPFIRIVGLSATLSNAEELAQWLGGRLFRSDWRPITVEHRLLRYKRATDKIDHLVDEVTQTATTSGKTLVFVNSRRRAESVATDLCKRGLRANYSHAGLSPERQNESHASFHLGELDALVATSTLEMGVNLPARKVVVFDNHAFTGEVFSPISTQRYLQFAGRAGRPGLDPSGEAVLFAPIWDTHCEKTIQGEPEPVRSGLFSSDHLAREVLQEVASRLSISMHHLEVNFAARSLWRLQGGTHDFTPVLHQLDRFGLIRETQKGDRTFLSATALGRIATQMALSPATVASFSYAFREIGSPTDFDLLLLGCMSKECTPKLGFNFDELDLVGDVITDAASILLDRPYGVSLKALSPTDERSVLSALKCAAILQSHVHLEPIEALAEAYDCYPNDLVVLKRNLAWVLEGAKRIFSALNRQAFMREHGDAAEPGQLRPSPHEEIATRLGLMLEYGIPPGATSLAGVNCVGPRRAQTFCREGIFTADAITALSEQEIAALLGVGELTARKIHASARSLTGKTNSKPARIRPLPSSGPLRMRTVPASAGVDPYRLRRAVDLTIDHYSRDVVRVSGGAEPHAVRIHANAERTHQYECDCADFAKGTLQCKHILRARLALHDDHDLKPLLAEFSRANSERPLRYALVDLWLKAGTLLDRYAERPLDVGQTRTTVTGTNVRWARR